MSPVQKDCWDHHHTITNIRGNKGSNVCEHNVHNIHMQFILSPVFPVLSSTHTQRLANYINLLNIHRIRMALIVYSGINCEFIWSSLYFSHDDVIKWKHFPCYWSFVRGIYRLPMDSSHKSEWLGALMFSLICAWTNRWANNRDAGDLRRHRAHYNVIVMHNFLQSACTMT